MKVEILDSLESVKDDLADLKARVDVTANDAGNHGRRIAKLEVGRKVADSHYTVRND